MDCVLTIYILIIWFINFTLRYDKKFLLGKNGKSRFVYTKINIKNSIIDYVTDCFFTYVEAKKKFGYKYVA